jgi:hypothetical protein
MTQLNPDPADVADLVIKMSQEPWPTTETDRQRYFNALGLHDLALVPQRKDDPHIVWRRFTTSLPGNVEGNCVMFGGEFLGLSLFCYTEPVDNGPQSQAGFASLKRGLSRAFGSPVEEWGSPSAPACLWRPGPLLLDMYCFQRRSSGIMLGPSHAERSAANDAAHELANPTDHS